MAAATNPQEAAVESTVQDFSGSIDKLEAAAAPFLRVPLETIAADLPPLERARLRVAWSYFLCSSFFMYLRASGVNTTNHPVKEDLERIKAYFNKIKVAERAAARKAGQQTSTLDVEASKRFINAGLAGNADGDVSMTPAASAAPATTTQAATATPSSTSEDKTKQGGGKRRRVN